MRAGLEDRLGGILRDVGPPHAVGRVEAAAVEHERAEDDEAAGRYDRRHTWFIAEIPALVAAFGIADVLDERADADLRVGKHVGGSVLERHVVDGRPHRHVFAVRKPEVAAVLVPGELRSLLGRLHDVLVIEEEGRVADRRPADIGHQIAEHVFLEPRCLLILLGDVIPLAAVRDVNVIDAEFVHLPMHHVDEVIAGVAHDLEVLGADHTLGDEVALSLVKVAMGVGDEAGRWHRLTGSVSRRDGAQLLE